MRLVTAGVIVAMLILAGAGAGQSFEVASVKPAEWGRGAPSITVSPGGRFTAINVTLRRLIRWAYDVQDFQIVGGPDTRNQPIYEVVAKGEQGNETAEQLSQMLRGLLTDRFKLKVHREMKEDQVYALTLATNPAKLRTMPNGSEGPYRAAITPCGVELTFPSGAPVSQLANFLSSQSWMERPVIDRTKLKGIFDIKLQFSANGPLSLVDQGFESGAPPPPPPPADVPCTRATIFEAVQNQLGLRLESQKAPIEMLVIDNWERPSDN